MKSSSRKRTSPLAWIVLIVGPALALESLRYVDLREEVDRAEAAIEALAADARDVVSMRAVAPSTEWKERPTADLIAVVNRTLSSEGIATSAFESLSPEGSRVDAEDRSTRIQSVRLVLAELSLADFGRFLSRWRREQPQWSIDRIDLGFVVASGARREESSAAKSLRVTLAMRARYHADT